MLFFFNPSPADPDMPCICSVEPDQLASEEAKQSISALFVIKYVNLYHNLDQAIWLADN